MAKGIRKRRSKSYASEESEEREEGGKTMFQRIFMGGSGGSSESYDDSVGSATLDTDSASEYTGGDQTDDGSDGPEEESGRGMQKFDRELRAKHRAACKNMTVSFRCRNRPLKQNTASFSDCFLPLPLCIEREISKGNQNF